MYNFPVKIFFILVCLLITETNYAALPPYSSGGLENQHKKNKAESFQNHPSSFAPKDTIKTSLPIKDTIITSTSQNSFLKEKITYSATDSLVLYVIFSFKNEF